MIVGNQTVHRIDDPARFFVLPYWNLPFPPALYRPLATATQALQWVAGGGEPALFRWASAVLLIGAGLALYRLAGLLLPSWGAWSAAALFMVHPVHVEATAVAVNQGELAVGLLLCLASALYIRGRRQGDLKPRSAAAIVLCYLAASLFKETGLVLPGLLLAAELTIIPDPRPRSARVASLRSFYLLMALVAILVLAARTAVLSGDSIGVAPAEALAGSGPAGRALTMLGVVPHWARLLFWPAHLQADYGPNEIAAANGWHLPQWTGALIVAAWLLGLFLARRRIPLAAFGLLWIAVALFPVHNVLVPTGVVLAERTLFLASAGAVLVVAALLFLGRDGRKGFADRFRWVALPGLAALLVLGISRSRSRSLVWHDEERRLRQAVLDAPRSYTAHLALARFFQDSGNVSSMEAQFRQAAAIMPALVDRERTLADAFRLQGLCRPAVRHYRLPLVIRPGDPRIRASLVACLLDLGRYRDVVAVAGPGVTDSAMGGSLRRAVRTADSALAARP